MYRLFSAATTAALSSMLVVACVSNPPSPSPSSGASVPTSSTAPEGSTPPETASPAPSPTTSPDLTTRPFTVLVLGGDNDFRTDAIMVVGVDPVKRTLAFASIPRDTINVPLPGGGTLRNQKINAFYDMAAKDPTRYPQGPGRATADMVGTMLGIRIDYYAATSFGGFVNLVRAMGKISITLPKAVVDPFYQVSTAKQGVRFPAGGQKLDPERALIFVRTRQSDNDFARARRQQAFLFAAGRQLVAHPELIALLMAAGPNLITDFPLLQVPGLVTALGSVDAKNVKGAVLGPTGYEAAATCPCGYALSPKLPAMRKLAATYFPWAVVP